MPVLQTGLAKSAAADYTIDQSLRFDDGDSAYLSRTPGSAGNRKTWTWSGWFKRGNVDMTATKLFGAGTSFAVNHDNSTYAYFYTDTLCFISETAGSGTFNLYTTQVFRDPSAWYHIVLAVDTEQGTAADRIKIYINGSQVTDFTTETYPAEDSEHYVNATNIHYIGRTTASGYLDGYLAEVYLIDGTALGPESFGETDAATNQWKPLDSDDVKDAVTFGTNGFYQKYSATELADSFTDSANHTAHTVTANGDVHTDTTVKKIGTASAQFDGDDTAAPDQLTVPSSSDWNPYGISFTVEFWLNVDSFAHTYDWIIGNSGADYYGWNIQLQSSGSKLNFLVGNGSTWDINTSASGTGYAISTGTWYHVAVVKSGTAWTMYVDGTSRATGTSAATDYNNTLQIGESTVWSGRDFDGYMDEVRISNTARYNHLFTPSTTAFTSDQYTKLLLHCDGADDGTTFTDSSDSGGGRHTITANGDVTNTRAQSKVGDSSIYFDGTGDYLSCAGSSDWDWSASDYTIEAWVRPVDLSSGGGSAQYGAIVNNRSGGSVAYGFGFDSSGYPTFWYWDTPGSATRTAAATSNAMSVDTWYHIAMVHSGTNILIFVDGTLDSTTAVVGTPYSSAAYTQDIGVDANGTDYLDGYLDEIRISDSARYTSSFTPSTTEFTADANTMLLIHSNWDGGLGADSSGNENDFAVTNLVATDQMVDSPTNNFCTLNPLAPPYTGTTTFAEGNLKVSGDSSNYNLYLSTFSPLSSGKWYCEILVGDLDHLIGISDASQAPSDFSSTIYNDTDWNNMIVNFTNGDLKIDGSVSDSGYAGTISVGNIIGMAMDLDAGTPTIQWYVNNIGKGSKNISGGCSTALTGGKGLVFNGITNGSAEYWNFGQDSSFAGNLTAQGNQDSNGIGDFYYEPPTDYLALCTSNLASPEIALPTDHFNTALYTGNGSVISVTGAGFQPDLVMQKYRSTGGAYNLNGQAADAVRGVNRYSYIDQINAESDRTSQDDALRSFDSDGFTYGANAMNWDTYTYVSWMWKGDNVAGGTLNQDGDIDSYVNVNTTAGFSIVKYAGSGTGGDTVGHGLSSAPELIIVKNRDAADAWQVGSSKGIDFTDYLVLNTNAAAVDNVDRWNDAAPSASVFTIGDGVEVNTNTENYIAYCFHSVEGYSKVGSYEGNGNLDGTFVYTGFRPAFVMTKSVDSTSDWQMFDNKRTGYNVDNYELEANDEAAEDTSTEFIDIVSNGFKNRDTTDPNVAETYIYIAFAESPFKTSNAR